MTYPYQKYKYFEHSEKLPFHANHNLITPIGEKGSKRHGKKARVKRVVSFSQLAKLPHYRLPNPRLKSSGLSFFGAKNRDAILVFLKEPFWGCLKMKQPQRVQKTKGTTKTR